MNYSLNPPPRATADYSGYPPGWVAAGQVGGGEGEPIDMRTMLVPIWRRKWTVVMVALIFVGIAFLSVVNLQHSYAAYARVIFDPERLRIVNNDDVVVRQDLTNVGLQNQIEILRSTLLLERVVDALHLENTPEFNPRLRTAPPKLAEQILQQATSTVWTYLLDFGLVPSSPADDRTAEEAKVEDASVLRTGIVEAVNAELSLRPIANSRVIELGFSSTRPALAASIVNTIAEQYIALQRESKQDDIAAATEMLTSRVVDLEQRLRASKEAVEDELSRQGGESADLTRQELVSLNAELSSLRVERSKVETRYNRAAETLSAGEDLWGVAEFRDSQVLDGFRVREGELLDQMVALQAIVGGGEGNPALTRLQARVDELRRSMKEEAGNIVAALAGELGDIKIRQDDLVANLQALAKKAIQQSRSELRLEELQREAQANQAIYESFLNRVKETSVQANLQTSDARLLTRAEVPNVPDTASHKRIVALAGIGGTIVGIGLALFLEHLNNTFRSPADIEARTGLSVLAAIPRAGSRRRRPKQLVADLIDRPNSSIAEAIRNLRTSILFAGIEQPPKVVMFTSSLPTEGKTTTATLVAMTSQQMGRSAVIVDCDLRRRSLANAFPAPPGRPGLFALLEGRASIEEAVLHEPLSGLHVLAPELNDAAPGNPADVLASSRFAALIDALKARYDLVVLDTPPTLVVSDSRILVRLADAVVFLVKWDGTSRDVVQEGLREISSVKAKIAGIALTQVKESEVGRHSDSEYYYRRKYQKYASI